MDQKDYKGVLDSYDFKPKTKTGKSAKTLEITLKWKWVSPFVLIILKIVFYKFSIFGKINFG